MVDIINRQLNQTQFYSFTLPSFLSPRLAFLPRRYLNTPSLLSFLPPFSMLFFSLIRVTKTLPILLLSSSPLRSSYFPPFLSHPFLSSSLLPSPSVPSSPLSSVFPSPSPFLPNLFAVRPPSASPLLSSPPLPPFPFPPLPPQRFPSSSPGLLNKTSPSCSRRNTQLFSEWRGPLSLFCSFSFLSPISHFFFPSLFTSLSPPPLISLSVLPFASKFSAPLYPSLFSFRFPPCLLSLPFSLYPSFISFPLTTFPPPLLLLLCFLYLSFLLPPPPSFLFPPPYLSCSSSRGNKIQLFQV